MPAEYLHAEGFVLTKRPAADPFEACVLFSAEHGALHVMQRLPKRASTTRIMLDLFDEASVDLESSNQGRTWFVREAKLIARSTGIGKSYETLQAATGFTRLVARNSSGPEGRAQIADLLRTAIAAFAASDRPDIVSLKCLYRFARDEGHPVKQQWFPTLPPADRETAAGLLGRPLADQVADEPAVARLYRSLSEYLSGYTEMLLE